MIVLSFSYSCLFRCGERTVYVHILNSAVCTYSVGSAADSLLVGPGNFGTGLHGADSGPSAGGLALDDIAVRACNLFPGNNSFAAGERNRFHNRSNGCRTADFALSAVIAADIAFDSSYCVAVCNAGNKQLALDRPKLVPVSKPNGGHGSSVLSGYRYAIEHGADWIFQTDSDGQTDPGEFAAFWEKRKHYDAVLGNRVVRGDGKDRKFVENTVCFLLRLIFGVKVRDANAPFRLMKTDLVAKYINKLPADYNLPNIMFTTYFVYFREKVLFLPITFQPREKGTNSLNLRKIVKIGRNAVKDFRRFRKEI